jgi:hypothetical protein
VAGLGRWLGGDVAVVTSAAVFGVKAVAGCQGSLESDQQSGEEAPLLAVRDCALNLGPAQILVGDTGIEPVTSTVPCTSAVRMSHPGRSVPRITVATPAPRLPPPLPGQCLGQAAAASNCAWPWRPVSLASIARNRCAASVMTSPLLCSSRHAGHCLRLDSDTGKVRPPTRPIHRSHVLLKVRCQPPLLPTNS